MRKIDIVFKLRLIILLYIFIPVNLYSQKIYKGNSVYLSDIVYNIKNNYIYYGNSNYITDIKYYFDGTYLYKSTNKSHYNSDIILTYSDGKIFKGKSKYNSDLVAIYKQYKLYNKHENTILVLYKDNKIYLGNSTYTSDIIARTSKNIHPIIIFLIYNTLNTINKQ